MQLDFGLLVLELTPTYHCRSPMGDKPYPLHRGNLLLSYMSPSTWGNQRRARSHYHFQPSIHLCHKSLNEFRSLLYYTTSTNMWQERWQAFVRKWQTKSTKTWLGRMYRRRRFWAASYLAGGYWLGMKSNQRSESLNSCLHLHLDGEM